MAYISHVLDATDKSRSATIANGLLALGSDLCLTPNYSQLFPALVTLRKRQAGKILPPRELENWTKFSDCSQRIK